MLCHVAVVRADVSEEHITSIVMVTRIDELVFLSGMLQLLVTAYIPNSPILVTLMMEAINCSETSVLA
jgi:hypothetical protein